MGRKRQPRLTFLDTHVVCWLYEGRLDLLSTECAAAIETGLLRISPMVSLELQTLFDIERIICPANEVLAALRIKAQTNSLMLNIAMLVFSVNTWAQSPKDNPKCEPSPVFNRFAGEVMGNCDGALQGSQPLAMEEG